jgi:hypothetical protein
MDNSTVKETWIDKLVDELVDAKDEVSRLTVCQESLDTMVRIILNCSDLDYGNKDLRLSTERAILEYVKAIYPSRYAARIQELKAERDADKIRKAEVAATEEA